MCLESSNKYISSGFGLLAKKQFWKCEEYFSLFAVIFRDEVIINYELIGIFAIGLEKIEQCDVWWSAIPGGLHSKYFQVVVVHSWLYTKYTSVYDQSQSHGEEMGRTQKAS